MEKQAELVMPKISMKDEFIDLDFGSVRLEKRFLKTMEILGRKPDKSIWVCSKNRAEAKATYRMLSNDSLDREEILRSHREAVHLRMVDAGEVILLIQDTSGLNYNTQKKMEGLGLMCDKTLGINVHSCIAVTASGLALGVLDQIYYNHEEEDSNLTKSQKRNRPLEEKESVRWVNTLRDSTANLPEGVKVVTVCDREGDMYELFNEAVSTGKEFLIRVAHNRNTKEDTKIKDEIMKKPCDFKVETTIPRDSRKGIKEREAKLEVRFGSFEVKRPKSLDKFKNLEDSHKVNIVYIKEEESEGKIEPIEWFLMTNCPVKDAMSAYEKVQWYVQRWKIERFHYVLKSGCNVEKLQERSVEKMKTLILMYSIIAMTIMNITYIARLFPDLPCTVCFEEEEWKVLYCTANKTNTPPDEPYTIAEAVRYLSLLGGPKRAPSDGPPGVKTIWLGLECLNNLLAYKDWLPNKVGQG